MGIFRQENVLKSVLLVKIPLLIKWTIFVWLYVQEIPSQTIPQEDVYKDVLKFLRFLPHQMKKLVFLNVPLIDTLITWQDLV